MLAYASLVCQAMSLAGCTTAQHGFGGCKTEEHGRDYGATIPTPADAHASAEDALHGRTGALTRRPGILMLGTLPVALTTARCSRDARLVRAVLFWMMSGPPMASSIGRFSLVNLGFWLICTAAWDAAQLQLQAQSLLRCAPGTRCIWNAPPYGIQSPLRRDEGSLYLLGSQHCRRRSGQLRDLHIVVGNPMSGT